MSFIELGLEKGYIEKQPSEDERIEVYLVNPRRIMLEQILTGILKEFKELGYTVDFDERKKQYIVNNLNLLKKEKQETADNIDKVESVCEECEEPYNDLKNNLIGSAAFISNESGVEFKEVLGILCSKLYNDAERWFDDGGMKKLQKQVDKFNAESQQLLDELDCIIRSMK